MNLDERQATRLHYEVMGIALAILGHEGESDFYHELDEALTEPNWGKLAMIQRAYDMLPEARKRQILSDAEEGDEGVEWTISKFKANLHMMSPTGSRKTA